MAANKQTVPRAGWVGPNVNEILSGVMALEDGRHQDLRPD